MNKKQEKRRIILRQKRNMNREVLLLRNMLEHPGITQRELSEALWTSLGSVNALRKECLQKGLIRDRQVTEKGMEFLAPYRVERALIFAAGFGSRFVPITYETPKGLVEVYGEPMVERQIRQLQEAGVTDITVMVGYMKEKFEYLTDKFGVKLLYNPEYTSKNTLATMYHAIPVLEGKNCYILNSDNWLRDNLYHQYEGDAWYASAYSEGDTAEWVFHFEKKSRRITETFPGGRDCWYMYGPAYFSKEFSRQFLPVLKRYYEMPGTEQYYWEHVLMEMLNGQAQRRCTAYFGKLSGMEQWKDISMCINCQPENVIYEFENVEALREFDDRYRHHSGSKAMELVSRVFSVPESEIREIRCLKAGMTNNSWLFSVKGRSYICRIPGEGTEKLINRKEEKEAYETVRPLQLTDELVYFDADSGYKISAYYENARNADPNSAADMRACMKKLRGLHESGLSVGHTFDVWEHICYYEKLCREAAGAGETAAIPFADYKDVRRGAHRLALWLQGLGRRKTIAHIDPVADNFIVLPGAELSETERDPDRIRLIDWEYCGMSDPLIDVAMCAIYSFMDRETADRLLCFYLDRAPSEEEQRVFYAYMALGGLLWALWGVYKEALGVRFSDYTIKMYRYCKEYSRKLIKEDKISSEL